MRQRHSLLKGYCFCFLNISPLLQWLLRLQWSALQDKLNFVAIFFIRWKTPDFDPSRIRLLIYSEIDGNRIILFDSKAVIKREEKVSNFPSLRLDIPYFFSLYYSYLQMNCKTSADWLKLLLEYLQILLFSAAVKMLTRYEMFKKRNFIKWKFWHTWGW